MIAFNDDWKAPQQAAIEQAGIPPKNQLESAIVASLLANNAAYTAILRGKNGTIGRGVVDREYAHLALAAAVGEICTPESISVPFRLFDDSSYADDTGRGTSRQSDSASLKKRAAAADSSTLATALSAGKAGRR
ncbi:MAG: hypothetical protein M3Y69_06835 [Verrucomicrobiota bacterium]|nr:hypothetical protein [Verrucomicrobiota bacterium]